jgi:hypothetical protein
MNIKFVNFVVNSFKIKLDLAFNSISIIIHLETICRWRVKV